MGNSLLIGLSISEMLLDVNSGTISTYCMSFQYPRCWVSRVDQGLPWLQAEVCFLGLPPGFPAVPQYLSHTFGCSPAPLRTGQADFPDIRLLG